jgi:hypothetical protein
MLRSSLLAVLLILNAPAARTAVIIDADLGGYVWKYNQRYNQYKETGEPVIIAGGCFSACTRFISLPNTCAAPTGFLYFHGLSVGGKVDAAESLADSKRWETPKAVALQVKHRATTFGFVKLKPNAPRVVALEPGVWRVYTPSKELGPDVYQVWLKVQATKLVRACSTPQLPARSRS